MFSEGPVSFPLLRHIAITRPGAGLVKGASFSIVLAQGFEGRIAKNLQPARGVARRKTLSEDP